MVNDRAQPTPRKLASPVPSSSAAAQDAESPATEPATPLGSAPDEVDSTRTFSRCGWFDSSLDLANGLVVIEHDDDATPDPSSADTRLRVGT